jgi:hypothetical protein
MCCLVEIVLEIPKFRSVCGVFSSTAASSQRSEFDLGYSSKAFALQVLERTVRVIEPEVAKQVVSEVVSMSRELTESELDELLVAMSSW